jgi:Cof subfamily protein (haloacid dehalogenase superfamily)
MIKLIATDMDGTLLNNKGQLPKNFFNILNKLNSKNIIFVAASGRPYYTLENNFEEEKDKVYFVAENGAVIMHGGNELFSKFLDKKIVNDIIEDSKKLNHCHLVLCAEHKAYVQSTKKEFITEVEKYYHNYDIVDSLNKVSDDIVKISIYDFEGSLENSYLKLNPKWKEAALITVSGKNWLDIGRTDVNKGEAIKFLQNKFNISEMETMVFGDNFNDIHMLQSAYYSYVMENAPEEVKKYGRFTAESNDDEGVVRVIEDKILEKYV